MSTENLRALLFAYAYLLQIKVLQGVSKVCHFKGLPRIHEARMIASSYLSVGMKTSWLPLEEFS